MNIKRIINESVVEYVSETQEFWYHGTPDNRGVKETGSFQPKTDTTDYIVDPQKYYGLQQQMQDARNSGNEDEYFNLLDQAGSLRKNLTYNKPIYFTNKRSVANTYADDKRAFDYQNAEPSIFQTTIDDSGKTLKVPAFGERFRGIKADVVKQSLIKAGVSEEEVDKYFNMFTTNIRNGKMTSETLGIIAQQLGFDIIDVLGVLDSYHGGDVQSTVRMVFDPSKITVS